MKSRAKAILACGLATLIFLLLFSLYGYDRTWRLWGISTMSPHFADLRNITGGAESYAQGFDPMIKNPGDPWQRRMNYPRVWQSLYLIGINQNHTTYIGIVFILLFLIGICLILPQASNITIALVMLAALSPATLLGIERGNNDLPIFFLVALSVVAIKKSPILSAAVVLIGFVLKLFPIFGCSVLLRINRTMFWKYAVSLFVAGVMYLVLTYSDNLIIGELSTKSMGLSYGVNVFWMRAMSLNLTMGWYARLLSFLTVLIAFWYAFTALLRFDFPPEGQCEDKYLDAFRAGAAIYLGTFLLGDNYDYRLMFLILTIPQLVVWTKCSPRDISLRSIGVILFIFLSQWYLFNRRIIYYLPYGHYVSYVIDQLFKWSVFFGLFYLFVWSMPNWTKGYAQKLYFLIKRST